MKRIREIAHELNTLGLSRQTVLDNIRASFDQLWTMEARAAALRKEAVAIIEKET